MSRKTTTSTDVKRRYNEKVYSQLATQIPKELSDSFKAKCKEKGISQRQFLIEAIENFIKD